MLKWLKRIGGKWDLVGAASIFLTEIGWTHTYTLKRHTKTGEESAEVFNFETGWSKRIDVQDARRVINQHGMWFEEKHA
jgi:hypothetical protein